MNIRITRQLGAMTMIAAALALGACGSSTRQDEPTTIPDRIDRLGEIEVVTHTHATRSANYDTWGQHQSWSLRWRGQTIEIDSVGGMWLDKPTRVRDVHALFAVGAPERPDLLVLVGDPNNASVFHRLSQDGGQLTMPIACKTFGGNNGVRVLEGQGAGASFQGPAYQTLSGARMLLLGSACVYDTQSRRSATIPRLPDGLSVPYGAGGAVLSPDHRSLARVAHSRDGALMLAVAELDGTEWRTLPIDPARMRHARFEDIDAAWIAHHFEWRRGADGLDRMRAKASFKPLPWRGAYLAGSPQYNVPHLAADQTEAFTAFLARVPGARRLPDYRYPNSGQVERRFEIDQETVVVSPDGFYVLRSGKPYWPGQPGDPKLQDALVHRLGAAFDAELASGRHDALFAGELQTR
jgi:hypothetical protein